jgi:hypothetical protein
MTPDPRAPLDDFEAWLLRRTADAVEAGDVSETLLRQVWNELETPCGEREPDRRESAIRRLLDLGGVSREEAEAAQHMIQEYPEEIRRRFTRWLAEGWLRTHRRAYRNRQTEDE